MLGHIKGSVILRNRVHSRSPWASALSSRAGSIARNELADVEAFVDAQFAKFTAWKTADEELAKRIDALNAISASLEKRIEEFEAEYRDEFIDLLTRQIAALNEELQRQESDESVLNQRIKALESELNRVTGTPATKSAAAKKTKK